VCRVPNTSTPRLGGVEGHGDGLEVAHLAHEDGVRVFAHGGAQGGEKLLECGPISRWDISERLFGVHKLDGVFDGDEVHRARSFISLMMAERVVLLPEPVGPVTSTSPERISTTRIESRGSPSCSTVISFVGITRNTAAIPRSCLNALTRKRHTPGNS
jgi:hypothetical protein